MATILLVDDDDDLVQLNRTVLEVRGHEVLCAYSAREAREVLSRTRPDIAVLDVMMETDTAGFELVREMHQTMPDIPVIMLSAIATATGKPLRFAVDETWKHPPTFMDKPVPPTQLAEKVEAILAR